MKNEALNKQVGETIARVRKEMAVRQEDLAKYVGISRTSVVNMEQGAHGVSLTILYKICEYLECEPSDLLPPVTQIEIPKSLMASIEDLPAEKQALARQAMRRVLAAK